MDMDNVDGFSKGVSLMSGSSNESVSNVVSSLLRDLNDTAIISSLLKPSPSDDQMDLLIESLHQGESTLIEPDDSHEIRMVLIGHLLALRKERKELQKSVEQAIRLLLQTAQNSTKNHNSSDDENENDVYRSTKKLLRSLLDTAKSNEDYEDGSRSTAKHRRKSSRSSSSERSDRSGSSDDSYYRRKRKHRRRCRRSRSRSTSRGRMPSVDKSSRNKRKSDADKEHGQPRRPSSRHNQPAQPVVVPPLANNYDPAFDPTMMYQPPPGYDPYAGYPPPYHQLPPLPHALFGSYPPPPQISLFNKPIAEFQTMFPPPDVAGKPMPLFPEFKKEITKKLPSAPPKGTKLMDLRSLFLTCAKDDKWSRFLEDNLEKASVDELQTIFDEICEDESLVGHKSASNVFVKFMQIGTQEHKDKIVSMCQNRVKQMAFNTSTNRLLINVFQAAKVEKLTELVCELKTQINGMYSTTVTNKFLQEVVELVPNFDMIKFFAEELSEDVLTSVTDNLGCRLIQKVIERFPALLSLPLVEKLCKHCCSFVNDKHGNYVIQNVIEYGTVEQKSLMIKALLGNVVTFSTNKFGSSKDKPPLLTLMTDIFGNYVVFQLLETLEANEPMEYTRLINFIQPHVMELKKSTYSKRILSKYDKHVRETCPPAYGDNAYHRYQQDTYAAHYHQQQDVASYPPTPYPNEPAYPQHYQDQQQYSTPANNQQQYKAPPNIQQPYNVPPNNQQQYKAPPPNVQQPYNVPPSNQQQYNWK